MKTFTACSLLLSGSTAWASNGAVAAGNCEALGQAGSYVVETALPKDANGSIGGLSGTEGRVLASGDEGFTPVRSYIVLRVGERVILTEGAKATLRGEGRRSVDRRPEILDASAVGSCGCITVQSGTRTFAQVPSATAGAAAAQTGGTGAGAAGAGARAASGPAAGLASGIADTRERLRSVSPL